MSKQELAKKSTVPKGIKGWLIVFNVWLALQFISSVIAVPFLITSFENSIDYIPIFFIIVEAILIIILIILEVQFKHSFILAILGFLFFLLTVKITIDILYASTGGSAMTGIGTTVWIFYIILSKRVRNTFIK